MKSSITLNPEDIEDNKYVVGNAGDNYIKTEMPFNSLMTNVLKVTRIIDKLIQHMLMHIKTQEENPPILHQIMQLYIKVSVNTTHLLYWVVRMDRKEKDNDKSKR